MDSAPILVVVFWNRALLQAPIAHTGGVTIGFGGRMCRIWQAFAIAMAYTGSQLVFQEPSYYDWNCIIIVMVTCSKYYERVYFTMFKNDFHRKNYRCTKFTEYKGVKYTMAQQHNIFTNSFALSLNATFNLNT